MNHAPYYQNDGVTLYHGRSEDILPTLPRGSVDVLLTDPPYFQVKDEEWDNQWAKVSEFLSWLGQVTDLAKPALRAHSSVWMFASPELTPQVERMLADRFRILNSVRWVKEAGWHQKADKAAARRLLTAWEGILFAEQLDERLRIDDGYGIASRALHRQVFAPIGRYLQQEREHAGLSTAGLAVALGYVDVNGQGTGLVRLWESGSSLPTSDAYERMREVLNTNGGGHLVREYEDLLRQHETLQLEYDALRLEYEDLRLEYAALRRPFTLPERGPSTDIWNFRVVNGYPGKHPCEKPQGMLRYMIEMSSRPGAVILDPFAGSGSTLLAARETGRTAIGIEMDEHWCEIAARRLSQGVLEFPA